MAIHRGRVILAILLGALVVSLWRTVVVERNRREVSRAYEQSQQLVAQLRTERSHLSAELTAANLGPSILASCSIPFWLDAVHDLVGPAQAGGGQGA